MSKRTVDDNEVDGGVPLKAGERPQTADGADPEVGPFEDDYEDEFESEDEIMVAGADGEPDPEEQAATEELDGT